MKRWKHLGFPSPQHYAARVGVNTRRIKVINGLLEALDWDVECEEGARLDAEKGRLVDQIAPLPSLPPLPVSESVRQFIERETPNSRRLVDQVIRDTRTT